MESKPEEEKKDEVKEVQKEMEDKLQLEKKEEKKEENSKEEKEAFENITEKPSETDQNDIPVKSKEGEEAGLENPFAATTLNKIAEFFRKTFELD